mmetsp:Transcript_56161/g.154359  ORF Transcript_56161/g.154359 Transcript_56161/m.154359 type:complete len:321 (+) Transcript_56161:964-1926(+)
MDCNCGKASNALSGSEGSRGFPRSPSRRSGRGVAAFDLVPVIFSSSLPNSLSSFCSNSSASQTPPRITSFGLFSTSPVARTVMCTGGGIDSERCSSLFEYGNTRRAEISSNPSNTFTFLACRASLVGDATIPNPENSHPVNSLNSKHDACREEDPCAVELRKPFLIFCGTAPSTFAQSPRLMRRCGCGWKGTTLPLYMPVLRSDSGVVSTILLNGQPSRSSSFSWMTRTSKPSVLALMISDSKRFAPSPVNVFWLRYTRMWVGVSGGICVLLLDIAQKPIPSFLALFNISTPSTSLLRMRLRSPARRRVLCTTIKLSSYQ